MTSSVAIEKPLQFARVPVAVWLAGALCLILTLQLVLVFQKSINWDEFFHFSLIHASQRGEPVQFLQVPFVYLFGWVVELPGPNITHIQIIRALTMIFELALLGAIYASARKFVDHTNALLCTLAYITAGYVFLHASALRADTISAAFCMGAIALGLHLKPRLGWLLAIAVLLVLAFVSSIKAALYAPGFLAVLYLQRSLLIQHSGHLVRPALGAFTAVLLMLIAVLVLTPDVFESAKSTLLSASQYVFSGGLFPQFRYFTRQLSLAAVFTILLVMFNVWLATGRAEKSTKVALALFAAPLVSVLFYRNAYPYFFCFILPPVAVALAPTIDWMRDKCSPLILAGALCANALILFNAEPREVLPAQQAFLSDVQTVFAEPVRYIDESGMIGNYPRAVNHFASGWALSNYRERGEAEYKDAVLSDNIPLLITNSWALINVFSERQFGPNRLLEADDAFLRANYLAHASMIYVAGKQVQPNETLKNELVATPGTYRVEGGPVSINGSHHDEGETINLERVSYDFVNEGPALVTLRWANAKKASGASYSLPRLYTDY